MEKTEYENRILSMFERYCKAAHKVQAGIATLMKFKKDYRGTEPKHLRVGVDMSKSDQSGLAKLLISKGVFTELEYEEAMMLAAEDEAESMRKEVSMLFPGKDVKLV